MLEIARTAPETTAALGLIKGMPRGMVERGGDDVLAAVQRGLAVAEDQLPKFPRAARWDRDPEFDRKVAALKAVRDEAAKRLDLDPGVLFSRERMEMVVRRSPRTVEALGEIPELRQWQVAELGAGLVAALKPFGAKTAGNESPYLDGVTRRPA